jgi:hypothetical protein
MQLVYVHAVAQAAVGPAGEHAGGFHGAW